eukprot:CAMPEP_0194202702 /NCGR_PEP_ID=MMETSP0156-20130528/2665_1 /TAXON_ID=33649 /ORGANISM="Thalassionema nitzschioides, Strain L26-B" /LENGTH=268 /DNA_ID=CAMNT_0038928277 /DNA_START=66 /DNA_END=872 /DNA_ORIENTATION=+
MSNYNRPLLLCLLLLATSTITTTAFQTAPATIAQSSSSSSPLFASSSTAADNKAAAAAEVEASQKPGYVPKWKKKGTLADEVGDMDFGDKGIKGSIAVKFQQGNVTKTTMAMPGQPLRDAATQAGQFIKYGCGKGECGTCEAMCNGKWIRPCTAVVTQTETTEMVIQVKEIKSATTSSGTFFSVKSFFMGFYNNVLGMVGFVKYRQNAKKNWEERQEYEDKIERLTLEKRQKRQAEWKKRKDHAGASGDDVVAEKTTTSTNTNKQLSP